MQYGMQKFLDSLLHYQGTVSLSGNYQSKEGILYGAGDIRMGAITKVMDMPCGPWQNIGE
jgi:hypothetical protein